MDATEEFFDQLGQRGHAPGLEMFSGVIRFDIAQDDRIEQWFVRSTRGRVEVSRENGHADATLRVDRAKFNKMVYGWGYIPTAALAGDMILGGAGLPSVLLRKLFTRSGTGRRAVSTDPRAGVGKAQELVTVLDGSAFIASDLSGDVDASPASPVGFFSHDTRLLSRWILTVDGQRLDPLSVDNVHYFEAHFFLTPGGGNSFAAGSLSVVRERTLCDGLCETVTILNYGETSVDLSIRVEAGADFADFTQIAESTERRGEYTFEVGDGHLL